MPTNKTKAQLRKERNRATAAVGNAKKRGARVASKNAREVAEQGMCHPFLSLASLGSHTRCYCAGTARPTLSANGTGASMDIAASPCSAESPAAAISGD